MSNLNSSTNGHSSQSQANWGQDTAPAQETTVTEHDIALAMHAHLRPHMQSLYAHDPRSADPAFMAGLMSPPTREPGGTRLLGSRIAGRWAQGEGQEGAAAFAAQVQAQQTQGVAAMPITHGPAPAAFQAHSQAQPGAQGTTNANANASSGA